MKCQILKEDVSLKFNAKCGSSESAGMLCIIRDARIIISYLDTSCGSLELACVRVVRAALQSLPPIYRKLLTLSCFLNYSYVLGRAMTVTEIVLAACLRLKSVSAAQLAR